MPKNSAKFSAPPIVKHCKFIWTFPKLDEISHITEMYYLYYHKKNDNCENHIISIISWRYILHGNSNFWHVINTSYLPPLPNSLPLPPAIITHVSNYSKLSGEKCTSHKSIELLTTIPNNFDWSLFSYCNQKHIIGEVCETKWSDH